MEDNRRCRRAPRRHLLIAARAALAFMAGAGLLAFHVHAQGQPPDQASLQTPGGWPDRLLGIRQLAENDALAAAAAAQALQARGFERMPPQVRIGLLNVLARIDVYRGQNDAAYAHARQALELSRQESDQAGQAEALLLQGISELNRGKVDAANEALTQSAGLMQYLDRPSLVAEVLMRAATSYRREGRIEPSVELCVRAMTLARRSGDAMALALAHQCMAIGYEQGHHAPQALAEFDAMASAARQARSTQLEAHALLGWGNALVRQGEHQRAEAAIRRSIEMFRRCGASFSENLALFSLASALTEQHRRDEALQVLDRLVATYGDAGNPLGLWWTLYTRGTLLLQMGRQAPARDDVVAAQRLAETLGGALYRASSAQQMAQIAAEEGHYREAFRLSSQALAYTRQTTDSHGTDINDLARRYEAQQRDRDIADLTHRNEQQRAELRERMLERRWLSTVLAGSVIALMGTAWFTWRERRSNGLLACANDRLNSSQQRLEDQTRILRSVLDNIADGVCVCDAQGMLYLANPAVQTLFGTMPPTPLRVGVNQDVAFFLPDSTEPLPQAQWPLPAALAGQPMDQTELLLRRFSNGHECWLSVTTRTVIDTDGQHHGAVAVFSDITVRRRAEAERQRMLDELTLREREYRTLAENLPDLVARYDRQLRRLYVNPALLRQLGLSKHDDLNAPPPGPLPPWRDLYQRHLRQVIETGVAVEFKMADPDPQRGTATTYSVRMVLERGDSDDSVSVLAIARDVTAMQAMQDRLQASRDQLRELTARAETAREDERRRIARELHDELGQLLTSLRMRLVTLQLRSRDTGTAPSWDSLTGLVDRTIAVTRDVVTQLRPAALDSGLVAALDWLIDDFRRHTGMRCHLHTPEQELDISDESATVMFRIVQESLTNVTRHAQASRVDIDVDVDTADDAVVLTVRDNGKGFDPSRAPQRSFGLAGMRERGHMLGGSVVVKSAAGAGTTVQLRMPLRDRAPPATALSL